MDQETLKKWARMDLWSEREFEELCCGLEPDGPRENTAELNHAHEQINRAVFASSLPCEEPIDSTQGDRFYGHHRFFRPADAIPWASERFDKFPKFPAMDNHLQLARSQYWQELEEKGRKAIDSFPAWARKQRSIRKTGNLHEWLKNNQGFDEREAEIFKKVLTDLFPDYF